MKKPLWLPLLLLSLFPLVDAGQASSRTEPACSAPAYHAFDFWLGEWDVFDAADNSLAAHARISRVQDGCALREEFHGIDGGGGESISAWDAAGQVWRQNWVSTRGAIVGIEGKFASGAMVLTGPETGTHSPDLVRGTWTLEAGGVREIGERSIDQGRTWQPWFDLHFRPAASETSGYPSPQAEQDRRMLAALDDEYQAAVKRNDTEAIGRLLPSDFILVNGKGQVFTRADLIAEAKNGTVYEHQDDTNKTIRVYGDTAVVTALLWVKGTDAGKPFDKKVWFSDTYVRTPSGWRYTFGQSSLAPPNPVSL
jgi:ketosteroid isomerase-like protein